MRLMICLVLLVPAATSAQPHDSQKLTVVAISHDTKESDYTVTTPRTSNTNCSANDTSVNCTTTSYGGNTQNKAVYRLTEVVTSNGTQCTLTRTARWVWRSLDWLTDGESFPAEINGKHMFATCRRGGNQGMKETIKYDILDIRPVQ